MTLAMIREACKWTTKLHDDGSREFFDTAGKRRARTHDDSVLAIHFMFACNESDMVRAEIDRLQATVAKLPTLADGTYWIPGRDSRLYHPGGFAFLPAGDTITWNGYAWLASIPNGDFGWNLQPVSECYRTEAEARAAAIAEKGE